jgi:FkbM family methyltransferase
MTKTSRGGRFLFSRVIHLLLNDVCELSHSGLSMRFATPNALCTWRVQTFSTKEPETLNWIDTMPAGSVFWDIGANIGLYSIYAGKKNCDVWSFEPSVFNLELLARNISLNNLENRICIVPLAVSKGLGASKLKLTTTEWGGALSTFGEDYGWDGNKIKKVFEFQTIGLSLDQAFFLLKIPQPNFIKIDVDGIEHLILSGGSTILKNVDEILIEINDDFGEQHDKCNALLKGAGMVRRQKLHSELIEKSTTGFKNTYNQIWSREKIEQEYL